MSHEIVQIIEDDPAQARLLDQVLRQATFRTNVAYEDRAACRTMRTCLLKSVP